MRQPEKEEQVIPRETAMNVSVLIPVESCLAQELLENKQDSTSIQNDKSSQTCQSGKFKEVRDVRSIN